MSSAATAYSSDAYAIAWVAALPHERAAGTMMLDERHKQPDDFAKNTSDPNSYSWGRIGKHNVVIASLPAGEYGLTSTATTAQGLRSSLPHIRIGLLVGIGAGVPGEKRHANGRVTVRRDIRLGDVVVSNPDGTNGGVVQYDFIKAKQSFERKGFLNGPPQALRNALSALQAEHELEDSRIPLLIAESLSKHPKAAKTYIRPDEHPDRLFKASYYHQGSETCENCSELEEVARSLREHSEVHYGTIASGNTLVKDAEYRDEILNWLREHNVHPLCFEMEAAGLMNTFPCMVIRGICDYGDSHKNDVWQRYAAATAAAFAKEFLGFVDAEEVKRETSLRNLLENS
jgi:nucleoside phosphorylase